MEILNENRMTSLSFPDFNVQKIDFSQKNKTLKIFVDGAWLDLDGGQELGNGILFFDEWKNLTIRNFDSILEKWTNIDIEKFEPLKDICEIKFTQSTVNLFGFARYSGLWTEWSIQNAKMHAEFEEKNQ